MKKLMTVLATIAWVGIGVFSTNTVAEDAGWMTKAGRTISEGIGGAAGFERGEAGGAAIGAAAGGAVFDHANTGVKNAVDGVFYRENQGLVNKYGGTITQDGQTWTPQPEPVVPAVPEPAYPSYSAPLP